MIRLRRLIHATTFLVFLIRFLILIFGFSCLVLPRQSEDGAHHDGVAGRVGPGADLRAQPGNARHASQSLLLQAAAERSSQELQPLNDDDDDEDEVDDVRVRRTSSSLHEFSLSLSHFSPDDK